MPTEGGGPGSPATGYRSPRGLDGYHQIGEHAELMTFSDALVGWHDFYVTAGAAAATLAGLLFVGLSLHIRVVVSHPDVRSLARVTLTDFFVILLIALALLQPTLSTTQIADWLLAVAAVSLALIVRPASQGFRSKADRAIGVGVLVARFGVSALAFVGIGATGVLFIGGDFRDALSGLMPVVVLLLVVAVRNTWDLLVTVADRSDDMGDR